ncbi:MAG: apolipoprotein N-acyltransferase [Deltaproteobacteria bacterium]|nr:apolipoprotein N-acyltransferase [Deltaproteobacteria bacterium]
MNRILPYFLGILSGILTALSQPLVISYFSEKEIFNTFYAGFISWVSFVPLMFVIRRLEPKKAFVAGLFGGLFYFGIVLYWLDIAMTVFGNMPQYLAIPALLLLVAYCSMYWGIWAYISVYIFKGLGFDISVISPFIFVVLEYLRNYLFTGFPWGNIAYSQYKNIIFIQISVIGGIYLVQYVILVINATVEGWVRYLLVRNEKKPIRYSLFLAGLMIFVYLFGIFRAGYIEGVASKSPKLKVAMLQGNIDQGIKKKSQEYRGSILSNYLDLLERAGESSPELVIWPEAAYPLTLPDEMQSFAKPEGLLGKKLYPFAQIIGVSTYFYEGQKRYLHNGAFVVDKNLNIVAKYNKSHLVPFGEYVPLGIPVEKFVSGIGTFVPGKEIRPVEIEHNGKVIRSGILICYEGIFPEISREHVEKGANLLVNLTNDAWYGISSAPYQHLSMYVFRAVENGRFLARVANTGITAVINPYGKIVSETNIFERTVLSGEVALIEEKTIYVKLGDLFAILSTIFVMAMLILARVIVVRRLER